jgi:hypothetical protein
MIRAIHPVEPWHFAAAPVFRIHSANTVQFEI